LCFSFFLPREIFHSFSEIGGIEIFFVPTSVLAKKYRERITIRKYKSLKIGLAHDRSMKHIEEIILTKQHYAPFGFPITRYSISDNSIDEFVSNLKEQKLEINPDYSEKEVKYYARKGPKSSEERTVTVPLATKFADVVSLTALYLRDGRGLELELRDCNHRGESGIICKLTTEKVDVSVLDKVREAMRRTYDEDYVWLLKNVQKSFPETGENFE